MKVDLENHIALEEPRSLWSGTGGQFPEAPHLYELDGRWYLMIAEGGTERGHGISSPAATRPRARSRRRRRIRSSRRARRCGPIQNTGHGDLVIGPDGDWLCVLLGVRPRSMTRAFSALGRETFVTPVRWEDDGWPAIDPVLLNPRPGTRVEIGFPDEPLDGEWIAVRALPADVADLVDRAGWLVLHGDGSTLDDPHPVFVGRRQEHLTNSRHGDGGCLGRRRRPRRALRRALPRRGRGGRRARSRPAPSIGGLVQEWTRPVPGRRARPAHRLAQARAHRRLPPHQRRSSTSARRSTASASSSPRSTAASSRRRPPSPSRDAWSGVYAVTGDVSFQSWIAEGDDE